MANTWEASRDGDRIIVRIADEAGTIVDVILGDTAALALGDALMALATVVEAEDTTG